MSRILLLVELKGGNDGLNTLVPYADPKYRELRPGDRRGARDASCQLDERVGLHEKLEPLMESWKARDLAILQGVGYPYPNRSHFRSIEIWDTASASNQTLSEGWVAQAFEGTPPAQGAGVDSIVIDTNALPVTGPDLRTIVMQDAENFLRQAEALKEQAGPAGRRQPGAAPSAGGAPRGECRGQAGLSDRLRAAPAPAHAYAQDLLLGRQLDLATRMLTARVPVVAIKMALGGFDTHANQVPAARAAAGVPGGEPGHAAPEPDRGRPVGRRGGDDLFGVRPARQAECQRRHRPRHGGAACSSWAAGVKGGLHGAYPSLGDLQDGDLRHTVDFRSVFATMAQGCWGLQRDFGLRQPQRLGFLA